MRGSIKYTRRGGEVRCMRVNRVSLGREDGTRQESTKTIKNEEKALGEQEVKGYAGHNPTFFRRQ